jgi:hypothetical protein
VDGYVVRAYNATTNASRTVGGTCAGTVTALTCSDTAVPAGGWQYTVQTRQNSWAGPESAKSTTVTVAAPPTDTTAPTTTDNSAAIGAGPHNVNKTVTLTATDNAGGSGVAATYYTTNGTTPTTSSAQGTSVLLSTDGTYTIKYFSVDVAGNAESVKTAGTAITIDKTAPVPTAVTLVNGSGNTAGVAEKGDRIELTLSERLAVTSVCSTWANDVNPQSISGNDVVTVTINDSGSNDTVSVTTSSGCSFSLGNFSLGANYVTAEAKFYGSGGNASVIGWDPSTRKLTITLGKRETGTLAAAASAATPTWTPAGTWRDIAGNLMATAAFTATTTSRF